MPIEFGVFESDVKYRDPVDEELKDNPAIIGVLSGTHFVPGGTSRNGRYYPADEEYGNLWEEVFNQPGVRETFETVGVQGCLGHNVPSITEKEITEGLVSHFTKSADPQTGQAVSYILNTKSGRALKTHAQAGFPVYFSSRADGVYLPNKFKINECTGTKAKVLNPKKYKFERFDVVLKPGFLKAEGKLQESIDPAVMQTLNESYDEFTQYEQSLQGDEGMGKKINEDDVAPNKEETGETPEVAATTEIPAPTADDKGAIGADNPAVTDPAAVGALPPNAEEPTAGGAGGTAASDANTNVPADPVLPSVKGDTVNAGSGEPTVADTEKTTEPDWDENAEGNETLESLLDKAQKANEAYTALGTPEKIHEMIGEFTKLYEEIGNPDQIRYVMEMTHKFFEEVGKPNEIKEALEMAKSGKVNESMNEEFTKKYGTIEQIQEALEATHKFNEEVGSSTEIREALEGMCKFTEEVGSSTEIREALEGMCKFTEEVGSPEEIRESLTNIREFFAKHGSMEAIESKIHEAEQTEVKNRAHIIAESTGGDFQKIFEDLNEGISEEKIVENYRRLNRTFDSRYIIKPDTSSKSINESVETNLYGRGEGKSRLSRVIGAYVVGNPSSVNEDVDHNEAQ